MCLQFVEKQLPAQKLHAEGCTECLSLSILFMKSPAVYFCLKQIIKLGQITGFEWVLAAAPIANIEPVVPKVQLC